VNPAVVSGLVVAAGIFVAAALSYGGGDGDLWWQRQLGEAILQFHALPTTLGPATFSAPDARWIPHEWVFALVWAAAKRAGAQTVFAVGCAALATLTLVVEMVRPITATPRARAIVLVVTAFALSPSYGLRAQVVGWPCLALVMLALERGPRRAWLVVPITMVWCNLHASGLVVPVIVAVHGLGRLLETRRASALASSLALAAACALASLATPFGPAFPRFVVAWSTNPATGLIYEWLPASPDKILILAGVLVLAALLVAGEIRGARLSWSQRLLALGLFAATMLHIRNLALFSIVTAPWAATALTALLPKRIAAKRYTWRADGGLVAVAICAAVGLIAVRQSLPAGSGAPAPAVAELTALHAPLRVACEDFSWCSRFADDTRVRVLLDGRTDAYPATVFADYRRILDGDALPVFARWQIDAAIVHADSRLARALRAAKWRLLRRDEPQVYVRPSRTVALEKS
jgi:hypothetical protein